MGLWYYFRVPSEYGSVPEWPKGTDCKSAGDAFGGSNPPAPTKQKTDAKASVFLLGGRMEVETGSCAAIGVFESPQR